MSNQPEEKSLSEQLNAESAKKPAEQKLQGEAITLIIDTSPSMYLPAGDSSLKRALDAALKLEGAGANVSALVLKEGKLVPVALTKEDLAKAVEAQVTYAQHRQDWNLGTAIAPVVDYMNEKAASQPQHFVILSDGMLAHEKGVLLKTLDLLQNDKVTLDFMAVGMNYNPSMLQFANILKREYPSQVIATTALMAREVALTLLTIASTRGALPKKKAAASPKPLTPPSAK